MFNTNVEDCCKRMLDNFRKPYYGVQYTYATVFLSGQPGCRKPENPAVCSEEPLLVPGKQADILCPALSQSWVLA